MSGYQQASERTYRLIDELAAAAGITLSEDHRYVGGTAELRKVVLNLSDSIGELICAYEEHLMEHVQADVHVVFPDGDTVGQVKLLSTRFAATT